MKKYILLFACVIATSVVFAQNQVLDNNESETTKQGVAIPIKGMSGFSAFLYVDLMKLEQSDPTLKSIPPDIVERYGLIEINSEWYVGAFADIKPEKRSWAAEYGVLFNGNTDFHITTVNIPVKNYVSFVNSEIANFIEIGEKNYPMMDSARRVTHAALVNRGYNLPKGYCGKDVVIGIVDIGFDYTHRNFYDSTQSTYRVKRVWNQTVSGNPPSGYNYGTEYTTQSAILAAQYSHNNETHGTHVAGMAAGGGTSESAMRKYKGMAPESDIVLVATTMQSDAIHDGLTYILNYAQSVGKPCVVNMSLGGHTGPHDGQDGNEIAVDNLFNNREGAALLVSAGNEGNDPLHLSKTFTAQDSTLYTYVVRDNGSTAYYGYVDIWGTPGSNFRVKVAMADSTSSASQLRSMSFPLTINTNSSQTSWAAAVISTGCTVQYATYTSYYYYNDKPRVFLYLSGTSNTGSARSFLIKVESTSGTVHMWNNSGKFNGGTAGTRGNTNYTTNNRASGNTSIMVASYDSKTSWTAYNGSGYYAPSASIGRRSTFSSIGPGLNTNQNKPEISAPGCEILSSYNKYDGNYSTSSPYITHVQSTGGSWWGIMQGTSMACPAATGIVALWMEAYPQLTYSQIKYLLRTTSISDSYTGTIPSNGSPQWGWGKIDAMAGLRVILQKTAKPTITNSGSNQICPGSTTTLSAPSGYAQYIWNTGQTTRSITVSQPGAYYVRAVSAEGFKTPNSDTINIRFGSVLSTSIAQGNQTICQGQSARLVVGTAGQGTSYRWSTGATSQLIDVTPNQTTQYWVTTSKMGYCPKTDTITVTVQPYLTTTVTGNQTICQGNSVTLGVQGGTSHSWSNGSTASSITVSPNSTTTYTVTSSQSGYCPTTDNITVTVQPYVSTTVTSDQTICQGSSVTLNVSGGSSRTWSTGSTASSITVSPNATTRYTVTSNESGKCSTTDTVTVTVQPYVSTTISRDTTICQGQTVTLTSTGGTSRRWSNNSTSQSITVTPSSTTRYTVTSSQNGYCSTTDTVTVTVRPYVSTSVTANQTICQGSSVTLSVSGGTSRVWSYNNSTTQSITVTPSQTTTYTVTSSESGKCSTTDTVTITVQPYVSTNISRDTTICRGQSVNLAVSGGTSRTWSNGATGTTITVTPSSTTRYTVTSRQNGYCSTTDTVTVTVKPYVSTTISRDTTICAGQTVNLTVSGGTSRIWSNNATGTTITVTPPATTTYTVVSSAANQCSTTDTVTVTVKPYVATTITPDTAICIGQSITLNVSGGTSRTWSNGGTGTSITITPSATATYTVTSNQANHCSTTDTVTVTVKPYVSTTISHDTSICPGEPVSLTVTGGTSRIWSNGNTASTITVRPITPTTYTVTSSQANQCPTTDTVTISIKPSVTTTVSGNTAICRGASAILTATGGTSRTWSTGQTQDTIVVTPTVTTTYAVRTDSTGICSNIDSIRVIVNQLPNVSITGDTVITAGNSATLVASGANRYVWSTGATSNSITVTPAATTSYSVEGTDVNGCRNTARTTVVVNAVSIASGSELEFKVYPIPTESKLTVEGESIKTITIYNILGKVIDKIECDGEKTVVLNVKDYAQGVYVISVADTKGQTGRRTFIVR
ncbi:MAG: S8 family peptidase [Bacteroidales bacterium]|nr:S8 family peptidase [Bacteroidales bacterium]